MVPPGQEVIVGAVTDPTFGKVVAFGLGGVLVEVLKDVTFRLAPVDARRRAVDARRRSARPRSCAGVRGARAGGPVRRSPGRSPRSPNSSRDFPEIAEVDLNPVFATPGRRGRRPTSADPARRRAARSSAARYTREEILTSMRRLMQPRSVAVIGASNEQGKIGNSVMRNLVDGGFSGEIHPVNPKADDILGRKAYKTCHGRSRRGGRGGLRDPRQVRGLRPWRRSGARGSPTPC